MFTAIPSQRKNRQTADAPTGCASRGWINLPRSGFVQQFIQAEAASRLGLIQALGRQMEIQISFRGNSRPFTPTVPSPITCTFVKQNSGPGRYAHIELVLEPIVPAQYHSRYSWEAAEDQVPFIYFDSVLEGIKRAMETERTPFDYFSSTRIRVVGGSHHDVDSSPMCYAYASYLGVVDYLLKSTADAA